MLGNNKFVELKRFQGDELQKIILDPLDTLITNINKYTVIPIYVCNFIVSKFDMIPKMVLVAYDDKSLITEVIASDSMLESILMEKTPDVVSPTIMVYQNDVPRNSIMFNYDENYYYSTSYLIYGKDIKTLIKENLITDVIIYGDPLKTNISIDIKGNFDQQGLFIKVPDSASVLKLPLHNYVRRHETYNDIFSKVANQEGVLISDQTYLGDLFSEVKAEQSCVIKNTNGIQLFKDFMKQKPTALIVYSNKGNSSFAKLGLKVEPNLNIVDVALEMSYIGNKVTHMVFYRYIENIVDKIVGNYDER